jgi:hypothetical protein
MEILFWIKTRLGTSDERTVQGSRALTQESTRTLLSISCKINAGRKARKAGRMNGDCMPSSIMILI